MQNPKAKILSIGQVVHFQITIFLERLSTDIKVLSLIMVTRSIEV